MNGPRLGAASLLLIALASGTLSQTSRPRKAIVIGDYRVLAADFHIHSFPFNWTDLAPWDLLLEARRQGLDAVAIAGHNHVWVSQFARWLSERIRGPIVLVSEEIVSPRYHLMAVGISKNVSWRQPVAAAIAEVHRQGGIAIAAHPEREYWPAFDAEAMRALDAAEVLHPDAYYSARMYVEIRQFYRRKQMAAIGSSDFHAIGFPGICRTYVFVNQAGSQGILDALRAGRTVVYDRDGRSYGDAELIRLAAADGRLPEPPRAGADLGFLALFSRMAGVAALLLAGFVRIKARYEV